jgi:hypothetical protein
MSLTVYVDPHPGYRADERPRRFWLDDDAFDIVEVEDHWYDLRAEYFRLRTQEGKRYMLRYDPREDEWALQSGFDGDELLTRPGIELVSVGPGAISKAESGVAGCERCRPDEAELPFDWIVADVLAKRGAFEFILSGHAHCPNCRAELSEKTVVAARCGIEVHTRLGER